MSRIPSDEVYKHVDCKYTGVILTSRRARKLLEHQSENGIQKPLLYAFDEMMHGELKAKAPQPEAEAEPEVPEEGETDPQ